MLLQVSDMEICCTYEIITNVQAAFEDIRYNSDYEFHNLYSKANSMAERPVDIYLLKATNRNTRANGVVLVSLLLTLNIFHNLF